MKWLALIKKLLGSIYGYNASSINASINMKNTNYILALSPVDINSEKSGYIIIIMLIAILILIGYTLINNSKK